MVEITGWEAESGGGPLTAPRLGARVAVANYVSSQEAASLVETAESRGPVFGDFRHLAHGLTPPFFDLVGRTDSCEIRS
jgi:hypothetical protein